MGQETLRLLQKVRDAFPKNILATIKSRTLNVSDSLIEIRFGDLEEGAVAESSDGEDERFSRQHGQLTHHLARLRHEQAHVLLLVNHTLIHVQTPGQYEMKTHVLTERKIRHFMHSSIFARLIFASVFQFTLDHIRGTFQKVSSLLGFIIICLYVIFVFLSVLFLHFQYFYLFSYLYGIISSGGGGFVCFFKARKLSKVPS